MKNQSIACVFFDVHGDLVGDWKGGGFMTLLHSSCSQSQQA